MVQTLVLKRHMIFTGFRKIENLESYTNLTTLWLGTNGIEKVSVCVSVVLLLKLLFMLFKDAR